LLALEEDLENIDDAFMKNSMMMVVDSMDPEKVKQQLEARLSHLDSRHSNDRSFYLKGAAFSPAFGMFGTMFGLINMLKDLQDFESLGPNMSICLITTFYGLILANIFFTPIANKLLARHEEELLCNMIICEGLQAIQAGENPKFIQERLVNLLPQYKLKQMEESNKKQETDEEERGSKKK
jgi:chemotaxis protein MotA